MKTMSLIAVVLAGMVTAANVAQAGYTPMDDILIVTE